MMDSLNWDCADAPGDMLAVIDGRLTGSGFFTRDKLFVRSLERLPWHYMTGLWGVEAIKELYTPEIAARIWPNERRKHFDFALAVLRGKPPLQDGVMNIISRNGTEFFLTGGTALSRFIITAIRFTNPTGTNSAGI